MERKFLEVKDCDNRTDYFDVVTKSGEKIVCDWYIREQQQSEFFKFDPEAMKHIDVVQPRALETVPIVAPQALRPEEVILLVHAGCNAADLIKLREAGII